MHDYSIRAHPRYFINDFENIFTSEEYASLTTLVLAIDSESAIEIGVITIDTLLIYVWDSTHHQRLLFDNLTLLIAKRWIEGK
jgi:hypothetical protein